MWCGGTDACEPSVTPNRLRGRTLHCAARDPCFMWAGLAPEIVRVPGGGDPIIDPGAKHSFLRPETMESLFIL